ncbi:hypothetical protein Vretimale_12271 [Volvox reticuliferus]|uniref:Major facilitator superfamily (MFS) profile domain-containing protein n=1 Tax=Volvox reticuliferus TaxID=1737510 RepID=A0A8J4CCA9_9CHLO|nr:hypothetical protein Vretifemale_8979 [Volvox reticuliferus]GIM08305.1 hypothetical protein Vretimale_12271 [Volvox reticuliferus]
MALNKSTKGDVANTLAQGNVQIEVTTPWHPYPDKFWRISKAEYPGSGVDNDPYIVDFLDDDAANPQLWPSLYKWALTLFVSIATLAVGFCSSAYAGAAGGIMTFFGTSPEVTTLGISLFVLGFALGPLIWAPLSEVAGRRPLLIYTYMALTAFNVGTALAPNMAALIVLRFFSGAFGSSPLTNAGGIIADMFTAEQRGLAMSLFAAAPFMGPVIGPIVGGFTGESIGWRWVMWLMAFFSGTILVLSTVLLPETYAPVLLRRRAAKLSKVNSKVYRSKYDGTVDIHLGQLLKASLIRPWALLFREPIVMLLSIYMAIIYGILYMLFAAFPLVFQRARGWSPGIGGLAFVGVAVGMIFAVIYTIIDNRRYVHICHQHGGFAPPEARLPPAIVGSIAIPIGLFWFAFTNSPSIAWIVCEIATVPFGFGMVLLFLSCSNYLVDSYLIYAASVLAANSVLRSIFGAVFPLFTTKMYDRLGIHWASALPAFLAVACLPFPLLFWRYGADVRKRCKYTAEATQFLMQRGAAVKKATPKAEDAA